MRDQILGGDNILTLSPDLCVFLLELMCPTTSIKQSSMTSGRDRGRDRGRGHDFVGGRDSFGAGRGSYIDRQTVEDKGPGSVNAAEGIITSLRSARRNLVALNGHN